MSFNFEIEFLIKSSNELLVVISWYLLFLKESIYRARYLGISIFVVILFLLMSKSLNKEFNSWSSTIGYFLEEGINSLKSKYEIYTSKKIDSTNLIKKIYLLIHQFCF